MLNTLVREISARWGLAEQGRPLVQMLVAAISNPGTGGLSGFLDKFRQAGWSDMVNSWVSNQAVSHAPTTAQVEKVLGTEGGLLRQLTAKLGLPYDKVTAAVTGILPMLIDRMTPDGTIPSVLPAEFASFADEGKSLLGMGAAASAAMAGAGRTAAAATASAASSSSGGLGKWLPWLIAALVAIFGLSYCNKSKDPVVAVAPPATESAPVTPAPEPVPAPAPVPVPSDPAPTPVVTPSDAGSAATSSGAAADAAITAPEGAGVLDGMHEGMPVLRVFFDTGKTDVATAFADKSKALVEFLQANPDVKAVISGFNDPTGDPARNAELSKQRAQAVQSALQAQGVAADRTVLEKPAETTDAATSNAAARRVDVMLRR